MQDTTTQIANHALTLIKQKDALLKGYVNLLDLLLAPENVTKQQLISIINKTLVESTLE